MRFKPNGISEANITAELYLALKAAAFKPYLEYTVGRCRFDCVIHDGVDILAIIEVKRFKPRKLSDLQDDNRKQLDKYTQFGIPVYFINAVNQFPKLIAKLNALTKIYS